VLLTDLAGLSQHYPPMMGIVPLAQVGIPTHRLHPTVAGTGATGNGLHGVWRVRADKVMAVPAHRYQSYGAITAQELAAVEDAVRFFLDL
jgi:hypothetical protein